jgi:hypothetical protein
VATRGQLLTLIVVNEMNFLHKDPFLVLGTKFKTRKYQKISLDFMERNLKLSRGFFLGF